MNQKLAFLEVMVLCLAFKNFNSYYCFSEQKYGNKNGYGPLKNSKKSQDFYFDKRKEIMQFRPNLKNRYKTN